MKKIMHQLEIPRLSVEGLTPVFHIASLLDHFDSIPIVRNSWPQYSHSVQASCKLAHNGHLVFLKFNVTETCLLANAVTNQAVHEDSCVEFFVAFEDDERYYNLEFNCLGWAKVAYGPDRENRTKVPPEIVEKIVSATKVEASGRSRGKIFQWEITLVIPEEVFCFHDFTSLNSVKARGNFYKSGVRMPEPHFLTWKTIETAEPDFHRKDFFGHLKFM